MVTGTIRHWREDRGFGFVTPDGGGEDVFVHVSALQSGHAALDPADRIEFEIGTNPRTGRPCAINVKVLSNGH